ncbi:regulatory protein RecX [Thaumasiovibrio subtropicus]|uniref:regulatory protein RecX n=1 Tax=Thaumasiovibrio subtropicus TaxID=1891207 RepID=UPI000B354270|nr:regulatory protein RecX [Thaumasiovibrio subtropicus]
MKQSAYEAAVGLLSRRDHGEKELRSKLLSKGFAFEEVTDALTRCKEYGYLDDSRYCELMLRNGINKGWGPQRIQQSLKQKGIADSRIQEMFLDLDIDWFEQARVTAQRKFGSQVQRTKDRQVEMKEKAKRFRFLQYRGFDFEQSNYALEQLSL